MNRTLNLLLIALLVVPAASAFGQENVKPSGADANHRFAKILAKAKKALENGRQAREIRGVDGPSETEKRIAKAMKTQVGKLNFKDVPLDDVMTWLSDDQGIPILIDRRALEEIGITPDSPLTIQLESVPLQSALKLILRQLDLTYTVANDVVQITTIEAAEWNLRTEMYRLPTSLTKDKSGLVKAIQMTVVPDTWEALGGPSAMIWYDDVLIVSTTDEVLNQVENFLAKLKSKLGK